MARDKASARCASTAPSPVGATAGAPGVVLQPHVQQPAPTGAASEHAGQWAAPPGFYNPLAGLQSLASSFSTMALQQPQQPTDWYFDSGATSHMTSRSDTLSHFTSPRYPTPTSIVVNGSLLPVTSTGTTVIHPSLRLNNVLVSPQLIKNLIYVRQFTIDNNCSVEFDPTGCSVKDLLS